MTPRSASRVGHHPASLGESPGLRHHLEVGLLVEDERKRLSERSVVLDEQETLHFLPFAGLHLGLHVQIGIYQLRLRRCDTTSFPRVRVLGVLASQGGQRHPEEHPRPRALLSLHLQLPPER